MSQGADPEISGQDVRSPQDDAPEKARPAGAFTTKPADFEIEFFKVNRQSGIGKLSYLFVGHVHDFIHVFFHIDAFAILHHDAGVAVFFFVGFFNGQDFERIDDDFIRLLIV